MTARDDTQGAVGGGLRVDGQSGGHGAPQHIAGGRGVAETRILVVAVEGVLGPGRLPVDLVGDVADVAPQQGLEQVEVTPVATQLLEIGTDPRRPVRLQYHAALRMRVIEHLEQQVMVAVGRVVLQALAVQPVGLLRDLAHLCGGEETADDAEALTAQLPGDVLHSASSRPVSQGEVTTSANSAP